jgi:peroxiredoxin
VKHRLKQISCIAIVGAVLILNGCVTPRPAQIGVVESETPRDIERTVKNIAPDFVFRSEIGERTKFSESRGDITILVFPSDEGWPDCGRCCQLQKLAHQLGRVHSDVTVVSVFVPKDSCEQHRSQLESCQAKGYADLIALCDAGGHVRDLYGPHAEDKFFIIDANGRQVGTGDLADLNAIEDCVRKAVYEHEAYCNRLYGPQETDWVY